MLVRIATVVTPWLILGFLTAPCGPARSAASIDTAQEQAAGIERRLAEIHERAHPAIVRIDGAQTEKGQGACTGVIVTEDGHILVSAKVANQALTVHLTDGRRTTAKSLGWSGEWGIALAKLDDDGPWPHAKLAPPPNIRAGEGIATFAYSAPDWSAVKQPLMELEWVDRSAPGLWFMCPDGTKSEWKLGGVAFDLEGRLLGIECDTFHTHGTVFTHVGIVHSFWDNLAGGKNLDELRLRSQPDAGPGPPDRGATISEEAERRATAATVQVRRQPGQKGLSGVIITKDGLVATVAHHFVMAGGRVSISLPDGRDLPGEVVGVSFPSDIGLVRIAANGEFPYVEMGNSAQLRPGDACTAIGYGPVVAESRTPQIRRLKVVDPSNGPWSYLLPLDRTAKFSGGDCGGGIFDPDGRLVAIANPHLGLPWPHENPRIEVLRKQWAGLHAPFVQAVKSEFAAVEQSLLANANRARDAVVELRDGDRTFALGTVVGANGVIASKASLLPAADKVACRFADGRELSATVTKVLREHDLAFLKVAAGDLKSVEWAKGPFPAPGILAAIAGPKPVTGTIALPTQAFPAEPGHLRASFRDTENGLTVERIMADETFTFDSGFAPFGPQPLREGDILMSVEGRPIGKLADLAALLDVEKTPIAVAGDRVRLLAKREGKERELSITLGPQAWPIGNNQSARCSNFARVGSMVTGANLELLGGPVVDAYGRVVGLAIAGRQMGWILVLPAETILHALSS